MSLVHGLTLQLIVQIAIDKDNGLVAESQIDIMHHSMLKDACFEDYHCVTRSCVIANHCGKATKTHSQGNVIKTYTCENTDVTTSTTLDLND